MQKSNPLCIANSFTIFNYQHNLADYQIVQTSVSNIHYNKLTVPYLKIRRSYQFASVFSKMSWRNFSHPPYGKCHEDLDLSSWT